MTRQESAAYCTEPRYGMYVPNSTSGDYAPFSDADGKSLCEPHARRAVLSGRKVTPPPPPPCYCYWKAGDNKYCPQHGGAL